MSGSRIHTKVYLIPKYFSFPSKCFLVKEYPGQSSIASYLREESNKWGEEKNYNVLSGFLLLHCLITQAEFRGLYRRKSSLRGEVNLEGFAVMIRLVLNFLLSTLLASGFSRMLTYAQDPNIIPWGSVPCRHELVQIPPTLTFESSIHSQVKVAYLTFPRAELERRVRKQGVWHGNTGSNRSAPPECHLIAHACD